MSEDGNGSYGASRHTQPFPFWDRRRLVGEWSVEESVERIAHYKWVEERLSAAMGGWGATIPELDVKTLLGRHCYEHAWHADLWRKRLPELRETDQDRAAPPNDEFAEFMNELTSPDSYERTIEKLVGVYRVLLPHMMAVYTFHQKVTSDIVDAPTVRILKFMLDDDHMQFVEAEMMIQDLARSPELRERAGKWQTHLDVMLAKSGGVCGPDTLSSVAKIQKPPKAVLGAELRLRREQAAAAASP